MRTGIIETIRFLQAEDAMGNDVVEFGSGGLKLHLQKC